MDDDGFNSASEVEIESEPDILVVSAEEAKKYHTKKHIEIASLSCDTKIHCVYCNSIFTLSTAVAHLRNECTTMMYNMGKESVYDNAKKAKKARSQRCFNTKHLKCMTKFWEVSKDKWFLQQWQVIVVPQVGCKYPVLGREILFTFP